MKRSIISAAVFAVVLLPHTVLGQSYRYNYTLVNNIVPTKWEAAETEFGPWENSGQPYGCSNWSPHTSTIGKGIPFEQTATDCNINQSRWAQNYEKNTASGDIRPVGERYSENRIIDSNGERDAVGTLENWLSYSPSYSNWIDTNTAYNCNTWTPSPSTYTESASFVQTSNSCMTDQERQRQDREQERFTEEVRNVGEPITEQQTISGQSASRNYTVSLSEWANNGDLRNCTNWSPDASTVNNGQSFTQTATNCEQDQTRTRSESYVHHKTGSTVVVSTPNESRTLTDQSNSRESIGTKVDYVYDANTYQVSCRAVAFSGPPANQMIFATQAFWNGTSVLNISVLGSCVETYPTGKTFTGTDGRSYTVGPVISGTSKSLRQN